MDNRKIGLFDSGVGGLSILGEIQKLLPQESFVFIADQKHVPYGKKTKAELEELVFKIVTFLVSQDVKLVVVACNTATVYTIDFLREKFNLPIVGVVPVVKTLAEVTKTKKVGILATPATSSSPYLENLINNFCQGVEVFNIGGTGLEEMVENGEVDTKLVEDTLVKFLNPLVKEGVDAIALGCTHYPFLRAKIEQIVGPHIAVLDSGGAVARQVKRILENNQALATQKREDFYYTTLDPRIFKAVSSKLLGKELENVKELNLEENGFSTGT